VKEVLLNLLSNAAKYTPAGFIRFAAAARREEGGKVLLAFEVRDSGIGIRQEDMGALFVDFSRAGDERVSKIQGTGLGLSITRAICRAMGGDVAVESRYGEGSVFTATIRQGVADEAPLGEFTEGAEPPMPIGPRAFAAPGFRVLIVDDSATNLKVAVGLLAPYRVQADTCPGGPEAIELVQRNEYGLVLMDCLMPGMGGAEAAAAIRALGGAFGKLPIAALTADAAEGARERLLGQGFDDFLSKPIDASELRDLLGRWARAPKGDAAQGDAALGGPAGTGVLGVRGIEGLDVAGGMANAGGAGAYADLLGTYCREARGRMDALRAGGGADIKSFVTNVHALKSASANIGAAEISVAAALLEAAGLRGDAAYVGESAAGFRDGLAALVERIEGALAADAAGAAGSGSGAGRADAAKTGMDPAGAEAVALAALANLRDALEAEDVDLADRLMEELSAAAPGAPDTETRKLLSRVARLALTSDFQEAARAVAGFLRGPGE
jgi:CheY-like chemotaxis protein